MGIPIYVNADGQISPNLTQDYLEMQTPPHHTFDPYHARSGAKSNPHHNSTQARLHHRVKGGLGHIVGEPEQIDDLPTSGLLQEQDLGFS